MGLVILLLVLRRVPVDRLNSWLNEVLGAVVQGAKLSQIALFR
jgi:hypothetical protein